jgi:hypothetical protein
MLARRLTAFKSGFTSTVLATPIRGVGKLPAGSHTVTISAVDTLWLVTRGYIELTLSLGADLHQRHKIYVRPKNDPKGWSLPFRLFMRALLPSNAHAVYLDAIDRYGLEQMLQVLRGFTVGIVIKQGAGYIVEQTATGYVRLYDNQAVEFQDLQSLIEDSQLHAIPKASLILREFYDAGTSNLNANALRAAIQTLDAAKVSSGADTPPDTAQ